MPTTSLKPSGYNLERVYVAEMSFIGHPVSEGDPEALGTEMTLGFSFDWQVEEDLSFTVMLSATVEPFRDRPETIAVTVNGLFRSADGTHSVPVIDFIRFNAPALLMPFVRQTIALLTSQGLFGSLLLPPMNVLAMMQNVDISNTTGSQQLREDKELAMRIGIEMPPSASEQARA
jgi:preprotein translocase subunit SecB